MANEFHIEGLATGLDDGTDYANAWRTLQKALDNSVAGNICYTDTVTNGASPGITYGTGLGTTTAQRRFKAVNGDQSVDPEDDINKAYTVIDGLSTDTNAMLIDGVRSYTTFENWQFTGATGAGMDAGASSSRGMVFRGCDWSSNGGNGIDGQDRILDSLFIQCRGNNNVTAGFFHLSDSCLIILCDFRSNGGRGVQYSTGTNDGLVILSLFYDNTNSGLQLEGGVHALFNTADGNSAEGIQGADSDLCIVLFNRLTNNGTHGIGVAGKMIAGYNAFRGNPSGEYQTSTTITQIGGDTTLSADGYENAPSDFSLNDESEDRRDAFLIGDV